MISSQFSRASLEESEDPRMWELGRKLDAAFAEITSEYGGSNCSDIAGVDWSDRDQVKEYYQGENSTKGRCGEVVGRTAQVLGELLDEAT